MFLSICTWSYKRPNFLKKNQESLAMQTCQDFKQDVTLDDVGIGIPAVHESLQKTECEGEYFWIFDDDDIITDPKFLEQVKAVSESNPDVIIVKSQHGTDRIMPDQWPLAYGHLSNINYIVRRDIWYKHRQDYAARSGGDWFFLESVLKDNPVIAKVEGVMLATQRISKGKPEGQDIHMLKVGSSIIVTCMGYNGPNGSGNRGDIKRVTPENIDYMECLVMGGLAEVLGGPKSIEETVYTGDKQPNENTDILPNGPARTRGIKRNPKPKGS